ncbi:hypothetical protein Tco_1000670 [Tanacetum coccineum]
MPVIGIGRFAVATAARSITSSIAVTATFGGEENHRFSQVNSNADDIHIETLSSYSDVGGGFAFFNEENETGRYLALKAKEETELILWKARRRKRKYSNAICVGFTACREPRINLWECQELVTEGSYWDMLMVNTWLEQLRKDLRHVYGEILEGFGW